VPKFDGTFVIKRQPNGMLTFLSPLRVGLALALPAAALVAKDEPAAPRTAATSPYTLVPMPRGSAARKSPHVRDAIGNSSNWAGYAVETNLNAPTLGSVTVVAGTWTVPTATGTMTTGRNAGAYSATWVGLDGFEDQQLDNLFSGLTSQQKRQMILASQTVEQIGTEQDWTGRTAQYYAWVEFYPENSMEIRGFPVSPGDSITATVTYLGQNQFQTQLTNNTQKKTYSAVTTFSADRYCAEWIQEAPSGSTSELPLADFGSVSFTNCSAVINGNPVPISGADWEDITMVASTGKVMAVTSALNAAGNGFTVNWEAP
jgi:hypothetical protein